MLNQNCKKKRADSECFPFLFLFFNLTLYGHILSFILPGRGVGVDCFIMQWKFDIKISDITNCFLRSQLNKKK